MYLFCWFCVKILRICLKLKTKKPKNLTLNINKLKNEQVLNAFWGQKCAFMYFLCGRLLIRKCFTSILILKI